MDIDPRDEGLHPHEADEAWQEGGYVAWFDVGRSIGGNHRVGNEPVRKLSNRWCGVYDPDGVQFRSNADQIPLELVEHGRGYRCGDQQIFHDGEYLRLRMDEPECRVDLIVRDVPGDAHWMDNAQQKLSGRIYNEHYNVHCRVTGSILLDGSVHEVDGLGWRDHSWGIRHWDMVACTRTLGGSCGDVYFQCTTWLGHDGTFIKRGYIGREGRRELISDARFLIVMEEDGVSCRSAELTLVTSLETLKVSFEVHGGTIGQTRQRCGFEGVGFARTAAGAKGWGFIEVNNNPRLGTRDPPFVLHDGYRNGIGRRVPAI